MELYNSLSWYQPVNRMEDATILAAMREQFDLNYAADIAQGASPDQANMNQRTCRVGRLWLQHPLPPPLSAIPPSLSQSPIESSSSSSSGALFSSSSSQQTNALTGSLFPNSSETSSPIPPRSPDSPLQGINGNNQEPEQIAGSSSSSSTSSPDLSILSRASKKTVVLACLIIPLIVGTYTRYQLSSLYELNTSNEKNIQPLVILQESQNNIFSKDNILPLILVGLAGSACSLIGLRILNKMTRQKTINEKAEQKILSLQSDLQ